MESYLEGWSDFHVAMMGAAAALAGLLIVAASVNIAEVIKSAAISARLGAGLVGLVLAIVGSALGLIPDVAPLAYGGTTLVAAVVAAGFQVHAARGIYADRHPANRFKTAKALVGFLPPACYLVGAVLLTGGAPTGMLFFAAGAIAAIVAALTISWIALVEILR
jgi:hypothetical protein